MINQIPLGQLSKQLIQDLDYSIALNKGFALAVNYGIWLLNLNSSKGIEVYCSKRFVNNGDSLTHGTRMDLK